MHKSGIAEPGLIREQQVILLRLHSTRPDLKISDVHVVRLAQIQTTRFQAGYIEKVGALFPSGRSRMRAVVYISECSEAFHPHAHANLPSCSRTTASSRADSSSAAVSSFVSRSIFSSIGSSS